MVTFNVKGKEELEKLITENKLPCMRAPTVSELYNKGGYSVSVCVPRNTLTTLLPQLTTEGAKDIVVTKVEQIIY